MYRLLLPFLLVSFSPQVAGGKSAPPADSLRARNVVFIMGDDHAAYALGAYGSEVARTPNLDRLASEGARFDRAYVNSPVCTPSRQSIITGRYPHAIGVTLLQTALSDTTTTIAEHLKRQGYATGAVGKMHFNSSLKHGFEYRVDRGEYRQHLEEHPPRAPSDSVEARPPWRPFRDPARVWLNAGVRPSSRFDEDSEGTFYARRAVDFIEERREDPFCLWVSFREPHSPFNFPVEYAGRYDPEDMPLPAVSSEDARWVPEEFEDLSDEDKRGIVASYYTSVEYMDKNVGLVLDALEEQGLDENTIVIYVGDHGYLLGHHGRFEKHMMWEETVRAPLLIRSPGLEPMATDALVGFVDLVPTILDVLDAQPMRDLQGKSLVPLLEGRAETHRTFVFSEYLPDNKAMVRTERWKYVFTTGARDLAMGYATGRGPLGLSHRLYDMKEDPHETRDLADDPQYTGVLKTMQLKMLRRFLDTHPKAGELPPQLSLVESLVWFCEPLDAENAWVPPSERE